jgi:phenylalanyl-tRNA synthetase alpha chain
MKKYVLTAEGTEYAKHGLPEIRLLKIVAKPVPIKELQKSIKNFQIGLQWAKKNGWVKIENGIVKAVGHIEHYELQEALEALAEGRSVQERLLEVLLQRKLAEKEKETFSKKAEKLAGKDITFLTEELIATGSWRNVRLRPYNVEAAGKRVYPGRVHPLMQIIDKAKNVLVAMGFEEMKGPLIESSFYNFDLLFMPQDHPSREVMDTFFLKKPAKARIPEDLAKIVKAVHENGWKTGSRGWQYAWSSDIAAKTILRTHTTATSFRYLSSSIRIPGKYFSVDRVFRNEALDTKHLPEFNQIEGFVAAEGLTLRNMLGFFKEFYEAFGISRLKFKPTYNPYTEPSAEIFGWHSGMKKFIEVGNSGMFRPETLLPCGVKCPVIAWGLALERLAMLVYDLEDIRSVVGPAVDIDWIRNYPNIVEFE